jgi:hypothetical protein
MYSKLRGRILGDNDPNAVSAEGSPSEDEEEEEYTFSVVPATATSDSFSNISPYHPSFPGNQLLHANYNNPDFNYNLEDYVNSTEDELDEALANWDFDGFEPTEALHEGRPATSAMAEEKRAGGRLDIKLGNVKELAKWA